MKIKLPKEHLSHSQIQCVLQSPQEYIQRYLYGVKRESSIQQEYGTKITDILEGRVKPSKTLDNALKNVPRYKMTDKEIKCVLSRKFLEVTLLGRLDGGEIDGSQGEYKTGMAPWTQKRADESLQLRIYALIEYKNTGKIPKQSLTWLPTAWDGAEVFLKGEPITFSVQSAVKEMLETEVIVWKAYDKIISLIENEYSKI